MNEWPKLVVITFELMLAGMIIGLLAFLGSLTQAAGDREQLRVDSVEEMKEYRHYNKWDNNNIVFYQDIVELILMEQTSMRFEIVRRNNTTYSLPVMVGGQPDLSRYERTSLSNNILISVPDQNSQYRATLIRDPYDNGLIRGYRFVAEPR